MTVPVCVIEPVHVRPRSAGHEVAQFPRCLWLTDDVFDETDAPNDCIRPVHLPIHDNFLHSHTANDVLVPQILRLSD